MIPIHIVQAHYQRTFHPPQCIANGTRCVIVGGRGSGKTHYIKNKLLKSLENYHLFDAYNEYPEVPKNRKTEGYNLGKTRLSDFFEDEERLKSVCEKRGLPFITMGMQIDVAGEKGWVVGGNSSCNLMFLKANHILKTATPHGKPLFLMIKEISLKILNPHKLYQQHKSMLEHFKFVKDLNKAIYQYKIDDKRTVYSQKIKTKRGDYGVRWFAKNIGISPATLNRLQNHGMPDINSFSKICKWFCFDPKKYFK